jgi:hypothetical protein
MRLQALPARAVQCKIEDMKLARPFHRLTYLLLCWVLLSLTGSPEAQGDAPPAAVSAFNIYILAVESRIARQHRSTQGFLMPLAPQREEELRRGGSAIEQITLPTTAEFSGAILHHWRGTAFARGATADDFDRLLRNFKEYPQYFAPEVVRAEAAPRQDGRLQVAMRIRQQHVITVVMDTDYVVTFGKLDGQHGYSISQSTRVAEIDSPGTKSERALSPGEEHGFLWRMNTYWSYEERDGGLYLQIESVTLTRSIPAGLAWAVRPFVESVPRESLEFTLRSACTALRR